jgi:hypothetical protein
LRDGVERRGETSQATEDDDRAGPALALLRVDEVNAAKEVFSSGGTAVTTCAGAPAAAAVPAAPPQLAGAGDVVVCFRDEVQGDGEDEVMALMSERRRNPRFGRAARVELAKRCFPTGASNAATLEVMPDALGAMLSRSSNSLAV